jgi:hypothetical protein
MNPSPAPFLDEGGITITGTHLTANGKAFELSKINSVSVRRLPAWPLFDSRLKRPRTLQLVVVTAVDASPESVSETKDEAFMNRIMAAMDRATAAHPRGRRTR